MQEGRVTQKEVSHSRLQMLQKGYLLLPVARHPSLTQYSMQTEKQPGGLGDTWVENLVGYG